MDNYKTICEPIKPSKSCRFKFYKIVRQCKVCKAKIFAQYKAGGWSYNKTACDTCIKAIERATSQGFRANNRLKKKSNGKVA